MKLIVNSTVSNEKRKNGQLFFVRNKKTIEINYALN